MRQPNLAQLGAEARKHQYSPAVPLEQAQLAVAQKYGCVSWDSLKHHVEAIHARTWSYTEAGPDESPADAFLRLGCLNYAEDDDKRFSQAQALLHANPDLPEQNIAVAAVCARDDLVRHFISRDPGTATAPTGPHGWSPLFYLAYGRIAAAEDASVAVARTLLSAGADPNDGWFFAGLPTPFTVITGVLGGGEQAQPAHQHKLALGRLLLEAGADPNDGQAVYNQMFDSDDSALELLFEFGLGRGDGGPWRGLLPDLTAAPAALLGQLLGWAVNHDQPRRVLLLTAHGADVGRPLADGRTLLATALSNGNTALAHQLRELGAVEPNLSPVESFIAAALSGDTQGVGATPQEVIAAAREARPALIVWAVAQGRADAVRLLVAAGFDINALGRSDLPIEAPWQTALHTAVERNNPELVLLMLELGADRSVRDKRFDGTPRDWAGHLAHPEIATLLSAELAT